MTTNLPISVVLDTNELQRDWLLVGFRMQLLAIRSEQGSVSVSIPAVVLEELVANHEREARDRENQLGGLRHDLAKLGIPILDTNERVRFPYREYLLDRFEEVLGFAVLDWPSVSHSNTVRRAVTRTPPFDHKGGGYRDSLVWADVIELAKDGDHVALVSSDGAFFGADGQLHPALAAEVEGLPGRVEAIHDLSRWLLATLPAGPATLVEAVQAEKDQEFVDYYLASDMQDSLWPDAADMGFTRGPIRFEVDEVVWGGDIRRIRTSSPADGALIGEYEIDQIVEFRAILPPATEVEDGWSAHQMAGDEQGISGSLKMILTVAVLFEHDRSFSIDQLSWRRADGRASGPGVWVPDPTQVPIF